MSSHQSDIARKLLRDKLRLKQSEKAAANAQNIQNRLLTLFQTYSDKNRAKPRAFLSSHKGLEILPETKKYIKSIEMLTAKLEDKSIDLKCESKQEAIKYILRSCLSRISYNNALAIFYNNSPKEAIIDHLQSLLGQKLIIDLPLVEYFLSQIMPPDRIANDNELYIDLVNLIREHLSSPKLFDLIHEFARKEICSLGNDMPNFDYDQMFAQTEDPKKRLQIAYITSDEYKAGLERSHLEEILSLCQKHLSPKYQCFVEFYSINHQIMNNRSNRGGLYYLADFSKLIASIKDMVNNIRQLPTKNIKDNLTDKYVQAIDKFMNANEQLKAMINKLTNDSASDPKLDFYVIYDKYQVLKELFNSIQKIYASAKDVSHTTDKMLSQNSMQNVAPSLDELKENHAEDLNAVDSQANKIIECSKDNSISEGTLDCSKKSSCAASTDSLIKEKIIKAIQKYSAQPDDDDDIIDNQYSGNSNQMGNGLIKMVTDLFEDENAHQHITFSNLKNLVKAFGGCQINQEGCRVRFMLKGAIGDTITLPSLHSHHGSDKRNDRISRFTISLFKDLFIRAGVTPELVAANKSSASQPRM